MARRKGKEPEPLPHEEQIFEITKDTKLIVKIRDNASVAEVQELADNLKRLRDGEIHTLIIPMSYKIYKVMMEPEK